MSISAQESLDAAEHPPVEVLVVRAGDRRFGFLAGDVMEVQRVVASEPLPGAPAAVEGVIDLRGQVVAVLDFAERVGLGSRPPRLSDHLVITRARRHLVAIRVEEAMEVEHVAGGQRVAADDVAPSGERVQGIVRLADSLLVVADVDAFLGWDEAATLQRAVDDAGQRPTDD